MTDSPYYGNSNTTLVKVKWKCQQLTSLYQKDSNTTLVKVKWKHVDATRTQSRGFKYNTC